MSLFLFIFNTLNYKKPEVSIAKLEQNPQSYCNKMAFFKAYGLSTIFVEIILPLKPIVFRKCYYFCSATEKISLPLETPKFYSKDLRIFLIGKNPVTNRNPEFKHSFD